MSRIFSLILILPCICLTFAGCGTLFNSAGGEVNFSSNPPGADVIVDGLTLGQTPVMLDLEKKTTHQVIIKDDNAERTFLINHKVGAGWVILDILGGVLPVIVDAVTGDWYNLSPKTVHAELQ